MVVSGWARKGEQSKCLFRLSSKKWYFVPLSSSINTHSRRRDPRLIDTSGIDDSKTQNGLKQYAVGITQLDLHRSARSSHGVVIPAVN